ncbi:MAG: enoyl-CoA hydratase/isomerase family protein [Pseudomonadota bacterium]
MPPETNREPTVPADEDAPSGRPTVPDPGDVSCRMEGALGRITLSRPAALNALSDAMRGEIAAALRAWQKDAMVYAVVIDAVGETDGEAFCAGGDLREMARAAAGGDAMAGIREEYRLNWQIDCYTKPIVSLVNGLVVGSGVGLTLYGTHRVAGEKYAFAMPETAVGFFPDVGVTACLADIPRAEAVGIAAGGIRLARGEAQRLGFVTHCIAADAFEEIRDRLRDAWPVDDVLDTRAVEVASERRPETWRELNAALSSGTPEVVIANLTAAVAGEHRSDPAKALAAELLSRLTAASPTSLAIALRQVGPNAPPTLEAALRQDYTLAARMLRYPDFNEGVRALLIDKDKQPEWTPRTPVELDADEVAALFEASDDAILDLASRPRPIAALT